MLETREEADSILHQINDEYDLNFEENEKSVPAPLPYNQTKLQSDMNERYGFSLDKTLKITQALRDKYKAITYNRSDCQYLSEEHYEEAPHVMETALFNIGKKLPLDFSIKSKCFNNDNVTAHHGIIPQNKAIKLENMSEDEKKVYIAIVERYAMQFLPAERFVQSKSSFDLPEGTMAYTCSKLVDKGYKQYFDNFNESKNKTDNEFIEHGSHFHVRTEHKNIVTKETKPLKKYTPGSLVEDMASIAKYVKDDKIREILKEKDKDKKGENGSIGTVATRSAVVNKLIDKGYVDMSGKNIVSTELGRQYFHSLPKEISSADVTAKWWLVQEDIRNGLKGHNDLMHEIVKEYHDLKDTAFADAQPISTDVTHESIGKCPLCGHDIYVGKNKDGDLSYYCSNYKSGCKFKMHEHTKRFNDTIHITKSRAAALLSGKHILSELTSKAGEKYSVYLKMKMNGKYINYVTDGYPKSKK